MFPLPLPDWAARRLPLWWKRRRMRRFMDRVLEVTMPTAPPRACVVCGRPGCQAHIRSSWQSRHPTPRVRGRRLQRARAELFDASPLCATCRTNGRITVATIRDHVIPLAEGGLDDESNIQSLCADCHTRKTAEEARRGQKRGPGGRVHVR